MTWPVSDLCFDNFLVGPSPTSARTIQSRVPPL